MDFITLLEKLKETQCPRWSDRQRRLHALDLVRRREHYGELGLKDFDDSGGLRFGGKSDYVPLADRRPAIDYNLPGIIARDSVAMLFSESKFPTLVFENDADTDASRAIIDVANLRHVMKEAATLGSVGSVCIVPEVFEADERGKHNLYVDCWKAYECEPIFKRNNPTVLESVTRTWRVAKDALVADGYDYDALHAKWKKYAIKEGILSDTNFSLDDPFKFWYVRRTITATNGDWFEPVPQQIYHRKQWNAWAVDDERSLPHNLGFVPALWIFNLGASNYPDGMCQFEPSVNNSMFIDRTLSQGGQAIITAGSPLLAIARKNGAQQFGAEVGGDVSGAGAAPLDIDPDSVLEVEERNGAWLVQMSAESTSALDAYVRLVRTLSIENCGGSRISEESLTGARSGYAMELLNQALIWLGEVLRLSYGKPGLVALVKMIAAIDRTFKIDELDETLSENAKLKETSWGEFYKPSGADKLAEIQSVVAAVEASLISPETAIANIAYLFDITDVQGELQKAQKAMADKQQAETDQQIAVTKAKGASNGPAASS